MRLFVFTETIFYITMRISLSSLCFLLLTLTGCHRYQGLSHSTTYNPIEDPAHHKFPCPTNSFFHPADLQSQKRVHISTHEVTDSAPIQLIEYQKHADPNSYFTSFITKDVCSEGVCKLVELWLHWDEAGNFIGLQVPCNEDLTKLDHTPFSQEDYIQLHMILSDTSSVLKILQYEDLTDNHITTNKDVDAVSGATSAALEDVVIQGAVYTCYALWHTVYGQHYQIIQNIVRQRINPRYIKKLLSSRNEALENWVLQYLYQNPGDHDQLSAQVLNFILKGSSEQATWALRYLTANSNEIVTINVLVKLLKQTNINQQSLILESLSSYTLLSDQQLANILAGYRKGEIDITLLNQIYALIKPEHLKNEKIYNFIASLKQSSNPYIRNVTTKFLIDIVENKPPLSP